MGSEHPQQGLGSGCQKCFVTIFLRFPLNASAAGQLQSSPNRPVGQSENILQNFLKASRLSLYFSSNALQSLSIFICSGERVSCTTLSRTDQPTVLWPPRRRRDFLLFLPFGTRTTRSIRRYMKYEVQGDTSGCGEPPVDIIRRVPFGQARPKRICCFDVNGRST